VRRAGAGESLEDRSSAPRRIPHRIAAERVEAIRALRRLRMTAAQIAELLGMALSTVSLWLKRIGLGKRSRRLHRSQRVDGVLRGVAGWEFVHVCVDDHSRLAYVEVLAGEDAGSAIGFPRRALAWFRERGVVVERVMTDNGPAYRSHAHAAACRELGLRHLRTRPYRPRTNGKAERFIQTLLREWAYGHIYGNSAERTAQLPRWLDHYNFERPHGALSHKPPGSRLNNPVGNYN
jgi:transposase InsO family protein